MTRGKIGTAVQALLATIDGFEQLEVLVWLCRSPRVFASVEVVGRATKMTKAEATAHLEALVLAGIVRRSADDRFSCSAEPEHQPAFEQLVATYDNFSPDLAILMSEKSLQRLRTAVLHRFSEAFVFDRKKKDG